MKHTFTIRNQAVRDHVIKMIGMIPEDEPHDVVIKPHKEDRSAQQNRYMWQITSIIGAELGLSKEAMHEEHKRRFLVPIYTRDDEGYAEMIAAADIAPEPYRSQLMRQITKLTSTTKASVKQMSEFLDDIKHNAAELGIRLPAEECR